MDDHLHEARQQRAGLRAAVGRVERSLATPAVGRMADWAKELGAELDVMGDALQLHITVTEADDGLLHDIVQHAPRLAHRVDRVREDHALLRRHLERARDALPRRDGDVAAARDLTIDLLTAVIRHRHMGADLVYEAYNVDLEAAD
ncbi:MAG: hypothetical protein JWN29_564 [Acidimicrobiales bacterium]|nr:hypothetical protein [Acidimicrobiales bacterium]